MPPERTNQIRDYRDEFLEYQKARGFHEDTLRSAERHVDYLIYYLLGRGIEKLGDVTPSVIEDYKLYVVNFVNSFTKKRYAQGTMNIRMRTVKHYFDYLAQRQYILINPCRDLQIPKYRRELPRNILQEKEMERLLEQPDVETKIGIRDRALLETLYSTGIRKRELTNLNVYDVDLIKGTARINKGKGDKDRVVPVGKVACFWIEKYLKEVRTKWVKDEPLQALFIGVFKERLDKINCIVKKYVNRAFPGRQITSHSFRHSCATHMLRAGANIRAVQELLGHSSLISTQIYTKVSPGDLKEVHRKCHPRKSEK